MKSELNVLPRDQSSDNSTRAWKELFKNKKLLTNLVVCIVLISSLTFTLAFFAFYLKYVNGNVFVNNVLA